MRVLQVRIAPNLLHDLLTRHDFADVLRENLQNQIFFRTEDKSLAVNHPGTGTQIDFKWTGSDNWILRRRGDDAGPQQGARPRNQLTDTERFDDVVIRTKFEQPDLLTLSRAHGEHDDRDVRP